MVSFGTKEVDALALVEPVNTNAVQLDTEAYIRKAHKMRSDFMAEKLAELYKATVGKFQEYRKIEAAKDALYGMSDRELNDLGITRSEIDQAVKGTREVSAVQKTGFWKSLMNKFIEYQKTRAAYVHLMAMNSRELADIGLTRGEIELAVNGDRKARANDNLAQPSNTNDHRKAG